MIRPFDEYLTFFFDDLLELYHNESQHEPSGTANDEVHAEGVLRERAHWRNMVLAPAAIRAVVRSDLSADAVYEGLDCLLQAVPYGPDRDSCIAAAIPPLLLRRFDLKRTKAICDRVLEDIADADLRDAALHQVAGAFASSPAIDEVPLSLAFEYCLSISDAGYREIAFQECLRERADRLARVPEVALRKTAEVFAIVNALASVSDRVSVAKRFSFATQILRFRSSPKQISDYRSLFHSALSTPDDRHRQENLETAIREGVRFSGSSPLIIDLLFQEVNAVPSTLGRDKAVRVLAESMAAPDLRSKLDLATAVELLRTINPYDRLEGLGSLIEDLSREDRFSEASPIVSEFAQVARADLDWQSAVRSVNRILAKLPVDAAVIAKELAALRVEIVDFSYADWSVAMFLGSPKEQVPLDRWYEAAWRAASSDLLVWTDDDSGIEALIRMGGTLALDEVKRYISGLPATVPLVEFDM